MRCENLNVKGAVTFDCTHEGLWNVPACPLRSFANLGKRGRQQCGKRSAGQKITRSTRFADGTL